MEEKGTFSTEHIHCLQCLSALKRVFISIDSDYITAFLTCDAAFQGVIRGETVGNDLLSFERRKRKEIEAAICCPLRIAVIGESFDSIRKFLPRR